MSVSYTLESMILSNLRLLFGSAVKWSYAPAPAFLSRSSPVVWLSQLYWQLQCWKPVPALIVNHRAVVVPTPHAGNTCIVLSFKVDFDLHLRSIAYVTITKKFTENIFADSCKVAKFVQILFLEKIPLYGSFMVANQLFMQPFPTHNTQTYDCTGLLKKRQDQTSFQGTYTGQCVYPHWFFRKNLCRNSESVFSTNCGCVNDCLSY